MSKPIFNFIPSITWNCCHHFNPGKDLISIATENKSFWPLIKVRWTSLLRSHPKMEELWTIIYGPLSLKRGTVLYCPSTKRSPFKKLRSFEVSTPNSEIFSTQRNPNKKKLYLKTFRIHFPETSWFWILRNIKNRISISAQSKSIKAIFL